MNESCKKSNVSGFSGELFIHSISFEFIAAAFFDGDDLGMILRPFDDDSNVILDDDGMKSEPSWNDFGIVLGLFCPPSALMHICKGVLVSFVLKPPEYASWYIHICVDVLCHV